MILSYRAPWFLSFDPSIAHDMYNALGWQNKEINLLAIDNHELLYLYLLVLKKFTSGLLEGFLFLGRKDQKITFSRNLWYQAWKGTRALQSSIELHLVLLFGFLIYNLYSYFWSGYAWTTSFDLAIDSCISNMLKIGWIIVVHYNSAFVSGDLCLLKISLRKELPLLFRSSCNCTSDP